jgi:hypothetical protein
MIPTGPQPRARAPQPNVLKKKTVDVQHLNRIQNMELAQSQMSKLKEEYDRISNELKELEQQPRTCLEEETIQKMIDMKDRLLDLSQEIKNNQQQHDEVNYFMRAGGVLFNYYDVLEKGNSQQVQAPVDPNTTSILKYFTVKAKTTASNAPVQLPAAKVSKNVDTNRAALLDQYLAAMDPCYVKTADNQTIDVKCRHCNGINRTIRTADGCIVCNDCSTMECIIVDHDKPSYKEPPKEISYFAYKRVNHFNEWLSQVQGKETTDIPNEVYDKILLEIQKQKITNLANLTHAKIREILKKLRVNKYYEHTPYLLHKLTGRPIPHLSAELEDQLRNMFKMIQYPFLVHAPASRKNFLSYSFCLHKLVQLLGHDEYLASFPLLKSIEKRAAQDDIWRKICADLGWQFIPSI